MVGADEGVAEGAPVHIRRPHAAPGSVVVALTGPVDADRLAAACTSLGLLLDTSDACLVVCDVGALAGAHTATVDAVARIALTARRHGRPVHVRHANPSLRHLLELMGLADVVGLEPPAPP